LRLDYNGLTGSIPTQLMQLTKLTQLYLSNNQWIGTIPPLNIESLNFLNNKVCGCPPSNWLNYTLPMCTMTGTYWSCNCNISTYPCNSTCNTTIACPSSTPSIPECPDNLPSSLVCNNNPNGVIIVVSNPNGTLLYRAHIAFNGTLGVISNLSLTNSTVEVTDLLVYSGSVLQLSDSSVTINGNVTVQSNASIVVRIGSPTVVINGCASFKGSLILLPPDAYQSLEPFVFSNYSCHSGEFESIVNNDPCTQSSAKYTDTQLTILFERLCGVDGNSLMVIIVPSVVVPMSLILVFVLGISFHFYRKWHLSRQHEELRAKSEITMQFT